MFRACSENVEGVKGVDRHITYKAFLDLGVDDRYDWFPREDEHAARCIRNSISVFDIEDKNVHVNSLPI